jgi:hypothetical protein
LAPHPCGRGEDDREGVLRSASGRIGRVAGRWSGLGCVGGFESWGREWSLWYLWLRVRIVIGFGIWLFFLRNRIEWPGRQQLADLDRTGWELWARREQFTDVWVGQLFFFGHYWEFVKRNPIDGRRDDEPVGLYVYGWRLPICRGRGPEGWLVDHGSE